MTGKADLQVGVGLGGLGEKRESSRATLIRVLGIVGVEI